MGKLEFCIYASNDIAKNIVLNAMKHYNNTKKFRKDVHNSKEPIRLYQKACKVCNADKIEIILTNVDEIKYWHNALLNYPYYRYNGCSREEEIYRGMLNYVESFMTKVLKWKLVNK